MELRKPLRKPSCVISCSSRADLVRKKIFKLFNLCVYDTMSFINICRDNTDPFYRYKMPPIQSKVEGRGNGIKTAIVNLSEVSRALGRPSTYVLKYFGSELGAQTNESQDRFLINGAHDASELQDSLDGFIKKFVLCASCKNPETEIQIKKGLLQRDCKACGHLSMIDPRQKLSSYILKNPPADKGKKGKKAATATANVVGGGKSISDLAKEQQNDDDDGAAPVAGDDDDDDILTRKINAEAAALGKQSIEVNDDDWAVDMSKEAIEARAKLDGLTLEDDKSEFNQLGEWLLDESKDSKDDLPSDVEIYKKIVDLDILEKPETIQVLAQTLFSEDIIEQLEEHLGLLAKLVHHDVELEKAFLGGLERYIGLENTDLIAKVPKILMTVYDKELISEEVIISWGTKVSKKYVPKDVSKKVRKAAKPFIKWLQEAEEESDEE